MKKPLNLDLTQPCHDMNDIKRSYVIQWVGPFSSDADVADFVKRGNSGEVRRSSCFNFYYLTGTNKIGRPKIHRYFGIHHKLDGIRNRLNLRHSVLGRLKEDRSLEIWLGAFGDLRFHSCNKVEEVETLFIRYYRDLLTDNEKKKKTPLSKLPSISIINLWYDRDEVPWMRKPKSACYIDDVMVWENDSMSRIMTSPKLSEREE